MDIEVALRIINLGYMKRLIELLFLSLSMAAGAVEKTDDHAEVENLTFYDYNIRQMRGWTVHAWKHALQGDAQVNELPWSILNQFAIIHPV